MLNAGRSPGDKKPGPMIISYWATELNWINKKILNFIYIASQNFNALNKQFKQQRYKN